MVPPSPSEPQYQVLISAKNSSLFVLAQHAAPVFLGKQILLFYSRSNDVVESKIHKSVSKFVNTYIA